MARFYVSADILLVLTRGTFRVVENQLPPDAKIVGVGVEEGHRFLMYVDLEHPDLQGVVPTPVIEVVPNAESN